MATPGPRAGLGLVGAGAACAACCAGPIGGFVATVGVASVAGAVVFGALGLLMVTAVAVVLWRWERTRGARRHCPPSTGAVPVDHPKVKTRR